MAFVCFFITHEIMLGLNTDGLSSSVEGASVPQVLSDTRHCAPFQFCRHVTYWSSLYSFDYGWRWASPPPFSWTVPFVNCLFSYFLCIFSWDVYYFSLFLFGRSTYKFKILRLSDISQANIFFQLVHDFNSVAGCNSEAHAGRKSCQPIWGLIQFSLFLSDTFFIDRRKIIDMQMSHS